MLKKLLSQVTLHQKDQGPIDTLLGTTTHFKGNLKYDGTVRIDGKLEGEISSTGTLIIGQTARIRANIKVARVVVSGEVTGDIDAKESVEIRPGGHVNGNILTPELQLARGVTLDGKCVINQRSKGAVSLDIQKSENNSKSQGKGKDPLDDLRDKNPEAVR